MTKHFATITLTLLASFALISCEKVDFGIANKGEQPVEDGVKVVFNVANFEQVPFSEGINVTRASTPISQVCSHIDLAVFDSEGKVARASQDIVDENFGKIGINLAEGDYKVVVIAHSCNGSATISTPDKITFPSNKVTDTFYYYAAISVADKPEEYSLTMKRAVAKFRFIIEDAMPSDVAQMKFYYTGGSSTFSAVTGLGNVNSRQTELRSMVGKQTQYEVYTFPHDLTGELRMTVTALSTTGYVIQENVFEGVPVQRNVVTQFRGSFFDTSSSANTSFDLMTNDVWTQQDYVY